MPVLSLKKIVNNKSPLYIMLSGASLGVFFLISFLTLPEYFASGGGFSNYGVRNETVAYYTLGFLMAAGFIFLAARSIPKKPGNLIRFRRGLMIFGFYLIVNLLATYPYDLNNFLRYTHIGLGILLYIFQIILIGLAYPLAKNRVMFVFITIFAAGSVVAVISLTPLLKLLMVGELIAGLAFYLSLIYAASKIKSI